jgi:hypothetical protein
MLSFEQGLVWVEMVKSVREMWLVLLESTKDRFLGVDTPKQQVPPCVKYGTACLIIWDAIGCESC